MFALGERTGTGYAAPEPLPEKNFWSCPKVRNWGYRYGVSAEVTVKNSLTNNTLGVAHGSSPGSQSNQLLRQESDRLSWSRFFRVQTMRTRVGRCRPRHPF